ncbi:unnamed protein product [Ectocarpus sp. 8 AP-2014]
MCLSRTGKHLLVDILGNSPGEAAVERIFKKVKSSILDKTRAWRARWDAIINGSTGKSSKQRKCRVGLVEDSPEERERSLEMYMRLVRVNGMFPVMKAIDEIDPDFVEWGMDRLVEAEDISTAFERKDINGVDHLFGGTPEQKVGEQGEGILKIGMPIDGKQTAEADQDLSMVCQGSRHRGRSGCEVVHGDGAGWERDAQQAQRWESERHVLAFANNRAADEPHHVRQGVQGDRAVLFRHGKHDC